MKEILILGGSSDIGIEVTKLFLKENWFVTSHYSSNNKNLVELKHYYERLKLIKLDFSKFQSNNFSKIIKRRFEKNYDSFINLVGYTDNESFESTDLKKIIKTLTINTFIPIIIQKILQPNMIKKKWGRLVNCSGIGVKYGGGKFNYNYSLSQHCREFIPSIYKEWAQKNVFVNNIRIGVTDTKLHKRIKKNMHERVKLIPIKRMATPKEIANFIFYLASEKNSYMTGETVTLAGGE